MPTTPARARKLIKRGEATPFWKLGIFCIRLNRESKEYTQPIVVGIDPGSKREGFTVKSCAHTYINIQANALEYVSSRVELKRTMRRKRRYRRCPYRKARLNRSTLRKSKIPPSIKARWDWKVKIVKTLSLIYPFKILIYEDIKVESKKNQKDWNKSFCPLETGKIYGFSKFREFGELNIVYGKDTFKLREKYKLTKIHNKLSNKFEAHCIDSWVMANSICEGRVDDKNILRLIPLRFYRRYLHVILPKKNNKRQKFGGTISSGIKRGTIVFHKKYGKTYIGGISKIGITLHSLETSLRVCRTAKIIDCKIISRNTCRFYMEKQ